MNPMKFITEANPLNAFSVPTSGALASLALIAKLKRSKKQESKRARTR